MWNVQLFVVVVVGPKKQLDVTFMTFRNLRCGTRTKKTTWLLFIFVRNCLFLLQPKNPMIHHTSTCGCVDYSLDYWYSLYFITLKLVLWLLLSHINFCQTM